MALGWSLAMVRAIRPDGLSAYGAILISFCIILTTGLMFLKNLIITSSHYNAVVQYGLHELTRVL